MRPVARHTRLVAYAAIVAVLLVVGVVPLVLDRDSFPLSTYPMFSSRRSTAESVDTAVAVDAAGALQRLGPERIAGTDEIILATATVGGAIAAGTTDALCREIAGRVASVGPPSAVAVEVVTERFDALDWYDGDREPLQRDVHATCPVERAGS